MPSDHALRERAIQIVKKLRIATEGMEAPAATQIVQKFGRDPYLVLVSCVLSLRTKDTISLPSSLELFKHAKTPQAMLKLPLKTVEKLIYPTGFYRTKAKNIHAMSKEILERFNGQVPHTKDELMSLPGVGSKTANLVLADGFGIPAICVDTHVHRISNRLGLIKTKTVEQTEKALQQILPKEYWSEWNKLLVMWGQNVCVPISPFCSRCAIADLCPRVGVKKSR
ncbi:MAG TPA: endonuclease III [Candidatus Dependentiae bacterium]|nr:endonuclease III [Candidatus Dependentiae bacterium]HRQ62597.1 endonuclease III [Candidatus Dependentiae bacterium]